MRQPVLMRIYPKFRGRLQTTSVLLKIIIQMMFRGRLQTTSVLLKYTRNLSLTKCLNYKVSTKHAENKIAQDLVGRHFLTLKDFSGDEIEYLLQLAIDLKSKLKSNKSIYQPMVGQSAGLIFQKRSTRTRVSSEVAMSQLGGHPIFLSSSDIQLGVSESLQDTAKVLSRFNDIVLARVYKHDDILELSKHSDVPIVNGLSDLYHPLQILADFMTLKEHNNNTLKGLNLAWVGDGNNVLHSIMMAAPKLGVNLSIATPTHYEPDENVMNDMLKEVELYNTTIKTSSNPKDSVSDADVIITDTWISMGQEEEKVKRMKDFAGYQVTEEMAADGGARPDWKFLHCLPRYPYEVDDQVFYSTRSLVFDEAENRKWTTMAVFHALLKGGLP